MATCTWRGGAPAIQQVQTWTFATNPSINDTITVTIGNQAWVYTILSGTLATALAAFQTALSALSSTVYPQFGEITFTNPTGTTIVATNVTAGIPFTVTMATSSGTMTINGGASSTGTATTANSGPNDWNTAANWSSSTVPANSDTVIIDALNVQIYWGLSQTAVTLAVLRIVTDRDNKFILGLPKVNTSNGTPYPEYRADHLQIGATSCTIRTKGGRTKIDFGTVQTNCAVVTTGQTIEQGVPACLLKGTHASNVLEQIAGDLGGAFFGGESMVILTHNMNGGTFNGGFGLTQGTIAKNGGAMILNGTISTAATFANGTTTIYGSTALPAVTLRGETLNWNSTGILGGTSAPVLSNGSSIDLSGDANAKTFANAPICYDSSFVNDPYKVIAAPVQQVYSFAFSSTWSIGDIITVTTNGEVWTYTLASATIATFLAALVTAFNIANRVTYPQNTKLTAAGTSPNLTFTALIAGTSFTQTVTTNSGTGIIAAASVTTANSVGMKIVYSETGPTNFGTGITLQRS